MSLCELLKLPDLSLVIPAVATQLALEYVFISDLHIGSGVAIPEFAELELFNADQAFVDFLDSLCPRAATSDTQLTLILLGDLFDFPRVILDSPWQEGTDQDAITRLNVIADGHPSVFDALRQFSDAGGNIVIVPGNHDRELSRSRVFDHLVSLVDPFHVESIRCEPWIVYLRSLFYAEHGQQYHDINAFDRLLDSQHVEISDLPRTIGHSIDLLMRSGARIALIKHGEIPRSIVGVFKLAARSPDHFVKLSGPLGRFFWSVTAATLAPIRSRSLRNQYRRLLIDGIHTVTGFEGPTLANIERISEGRRERTFKRIVGDISRSTIPSKYGPKDNHEKSKQPGSQLEAACTIDVQLRLASQETPFMVFGHTHDARLDPVRVSGTSLYVLNTGTWSGCEMAKDGDHLLPFVHISVDESRASALGALAYWSRRDATESTRDQVTVKLDLRSH